MQATINNTTIKQVLGSLIDNDVHGFSYDFDDKYYYLYDNDCYLFVNNDKITVRCDRTNVFSSDKQVEIKVKSAKDIEQAYTLFVSMTMEDDE